MIWMDLTVEPIVIFIPAIPARYFSFQLVDMYTHNLAYIGARTTGPGPTTFMVAGPHWDGEIPAGIDRVVYSEGNFVYCVVRTGVNSELEGDLQRVLEIQQQYKSQALSDYCGNP
jgi:hypothetical protein